MKRDEAYVTKRILGMNVNGYKGAKEKIDGLCERRYCGDIPRLVCE